MGGMPTEAPLRYHVITSPDDPLLVPWLELYERAFPPEEKVPVSDHLDTLARPDPEWHVALVAVTAERDDFVAMLRYEWGGRAAYLPYLAVGEAWRGAGLGSRIYEHLLERIRGASPGVEALVFEVERPDQAHDAPGREDAERRIRFYQRLGARLLRGIHYLQEVPEQPPIPMNLMVHPFQPLTAEAALELARSLFPVERTAEPLALE